MINLTREEAQNVLNLLILWLDEQEEPDTETAIETLRAKLSAPEPEPVAWTVGGLITDFSRDFSAYKTKTYTQPLYTTPPQREWVGLTDEEVVDRANAEVFAEAFARGVLWAEAKLKGKNNG